MNIKKHFITGLAILLPLVLTIAIVVFIVNFLTQPFIGLVSQFLSHQTLFSRDFLFLKQSHILHYGSQIIILIALFFFTFFLGMIARWFFFKSLFAFSDRILHKIPIVNKVYKTTQEIIKTLFVTDKNSFKQVVIVPFPNEDCFVMGLVSKESPSICKEATQKDLLSILVPTAPNATTGYLLMHDKSKVVYLDMKPEDAIKYIVSCGVITPENPETGI